MQKEKRNFIESVLKGIGSMLGVTLMESPALDTRDNDNPTMRSSNTKSRDLQPYVYNKAADKAYNLWQKNPMAGWIINTEKNFCFGEEFSVDIKILKRDGDITRDTKRKDAQIIWDEFCSDPQNQFYKRIKIFAEELLTFGELHLPATVNEATGKVRIGYIDSKTVKEIIMDSTGLNPEIITYQDPSSPGDELRFNVIHPDIDTTSPTSGKMIGNLFYFRINYLMSQKRGHSEILRQIDWIDALDSFLFTSLEASALRNSFFYDCEMQGISQEKIDKLRLPTPKSAEVKVHNEKVKWSVITPDLKSQDASEMTRNIKSFILGSKGFPEHWFGEGGYTNRATAAEMDTPTMRMLKSLQFDFKFIIKDFAQFVIDQALIKKYLKLATDEFIDISVSMFDFERDDAAVIGNAFVQSVTAIISAMNQGLISKENAKKIIDTFIRKYGIEVSPDESIESIEREKYDQEINSDADEIYDKNLPPLEFILNQTEKGE